MKKLLRWALIAVLLIAIGAIGMYRFLPVKRVHVTSELIMLGDLNGDRKWDKQDELKLADVLANPFKYDALILQKMDVNRNDAVDPEDLSILHRLYRISDPYTALDQAHAEGVRFPRPREFFKYMPRTEYVSRPVFTLPHDVSKESPLKFLADFQLNDQETPYQRRLLQEVYDEALRFSFAWEKRKDGLTEIERNYAKTRIADCNAAYEQGRYFDLLLKLTGLVEDAETLSVRGQSEFVRKILYFREDLQKLLVSDKFQAFQRGECTHNEIFALMESDLKKDLGIKLKLADLKSPRDFTKLKNYLDRAEWQKYKSFTTEDQFKRLILFAQYDRRYLRSVSRTSPRMTDVQLRNHNLPMILLFREAMDITGGDKKAAVGLLDEAIRIPLGWVKSIPVDLLPSSLALDNFLLPGNMEDGSDKSRHWNVFGGIALYKSPEESLVLSLQREIMDARESKYSADAMREFIRDTIANINGIYYIVSMNPGRDWLFQPKEKRK